MRLLITLLTILIPATLYAGTAWKPPGASSGGLSQTSADARYPQKNGVGAFSRISSVAADGTHYVSFSNSAPYTGPRANCVFATISSVYFCTSTGTCRRTDR